MEAETRTVMTEDQQQESVSKTPGDGVVNEALVKEPPQVAALDAAAKAAT
jgi:hypothetical protein